MDRRDRAPAIFMAIVALALVGWGLAWLLLAGEENPGQAVRRGPRYAAEYAAWLTDVDAAHQRFVAAGGSGDAAGAYEAARTLREGFRALLRSASGAVQVGYAPGAEGLVAELLREDAARGESVRETLGEAPAARLFEATPALEEQLSRYVESLRREDAAAIAARYRDFDEAFRAWRALAEPTGDQS